MTAKELTSDIEARNRRFAGADILVRAVGVTLGPRGRNVILEGAAVTPHVTKEGDTVTRTFELEDRFQNIGAQMVKEVAARANSEAGDGTSTATVLAWAMIHEGVILAGGAAIIHVGGKSEAEVRAPMRRRTISGTSCPRCAKRLTMRSRRL